MTTDHRIEATVSTAISLLGDRARGAVVPLWLPRGRDHDLALSLGLLDLPRDEYTATVKGVQRRLLGVGVTAVLVRVSPARLVAELERMGLTSTQPHRAAALASIHHRQETDRDHS